MEIRDPVHGSIHILDEEAPVIMNPFFQRLRGIKQLGLSEYVFPGATHSRFLHSIGVMSIGEKVFNKLFKEIEKGNVKEISMFEVEDKFFEEKLLDSLSTDEQKKAENASLLTARYLWNFLSGMVSKHKLQIAA